MSIRIGILAVQGAFAEHKQALDRLGIPSFEIRQKSDLIHGSMDGLILPGGESTVMGKLLREQDMFSQLQQAIIEGLPVFGTCAGLILLAKEISNDERRYFSCMDITVERNAYGRQLGSFHTTAPFAGIGAVPMTFIRAPRIVRTGSGVDILAVVDRQITAARQEHMLVTAFHPELTGDLRIHQYFINSLCRKKVQLFSASCV